MLRTYRYLLLGLLLFALGFLLLVCYIRSERPPRSESLRFVEGGTHAKTYEILSDRTAWRRWM